MPQTDYHELGAVDCRDGRVTLYYVLATVGMLDAAKAYLRGWAEMTDAVFEDYDNENIFSE